MNATQTLYKVSHPLRISRYGAHTSLSTVERIEAIDALMQMLGTTLSIQAQLDYLEQTLRNVSFLPIRQLFRRLARTTADYAGFLATGIADLGGYAEPASLYRLNDVAQSLGFADCLIGIHDGMRRLRTADAVLREYQESADANKDSASKRFFEECLRRNAQLLWQINNNLPHE
ncbi:MULTISPECIES: hypothetical protein [Pseudomonas]|uniref:Uncharacterized protein n=1 Tax=Pseudomonas hamedanensis TaxID=2745504 RepID=A0A9E6TH85_9PSED|nr:MULTISPECIES: hypothetical protein [Pseudomonas]MBC3209453.1 hypothetical protein [Pseudomonas sp. SWRI111]MBC3269040.1 hypothetical protein [Pseudomonas sp. SWRI81]MBC3776556.1 hypothetical protein [Pseudomonas sp. SWRI99]QXI17917.1 hypothetical protein HU739_002660 [Pseudomonas hamedanensis]